MPQSNSKGKQHARVRDCHNAWLGDYPKSWRPTMLRVARRRLQRESDLIASLQQDAEDERGDIYRRYWDWYSDDDNERNIEFSRWADYLKTGVYPEF
jgi:hypothetical protein